MTKKKKFKLKDSMDKLGIVGLFLTAIFSPCCFPVFAFGASALGLGSFELFGGWTMWIFQAMVLISIMGLYISYRKHRFFHPLLIAIFSGFLIFYAYHFNESDNWIYFIYAGMIGLLTATIWNYKLNRMPGDCDTCITINGKDIDFNSTIVCPDCGYAKTEIMPAESCVYFYVCEKCNSRLKPLKDDCCVYCSYGSKKCPPVQAGISCC